MLKDKIYKVISVETTYAGTYYFVSLENENIIFSRDIDEAMNFYVLDNEDVHYYLELICDKLWKKSINSTISAKDIKEFNILTAKISIDTNKEQYKNEEFEKMVALSKLTEKEIDLLGLHEYGLLFTLSDGLNEEDGVTKELKYTGNFLKNGNIALGSLGSIAKSNITPSDSFYDQIKKLIK